MKNKKFKGISTLTLHTAAKENNNSSHTTPIYATSTFTFDTAQSNGLQVPFKDTVVNKKTKDSVRVYYGKDTLHYAIKDRRGDFLSQPSNNPFDLSDTSVVKRRVDYDPVTKTYSIADLIAGKVLMALL